MRQALANMCVILAALAFTSPPLSAQAAEPTQTPALDGIFSAFKTYPVIGLTDVHGDAESGTFYTSLLRDPRFAANVGNVVVEFGGAGQQAVIDRYVAGEDVPYEQLRRVWLDVVGWYPGVVETMYPTFFAQVRAVNLSLPPARRIRVWLGEPPMDWSTIRTAADAYPYGGKRNEHPAELIDREIMAKGKKALVIYGGGHFTLQPGNPYPGDTTIKARVEAKYPGSVYAIWVHMAAEPACQAEVLARTRDLPKGTLIAPIKGGWVEALYSKPGCYSSGRARGAMADALLYLGDPTGFRQSPVDPRAFLDDAYFRELSRRNQIIIGEPLDWAAFVQQSGQ
jgi:hypothetical protein